MSDAGPADRPKTDVDIRPVGAEGFRVIAALYAQAFDDPWPEPSVRELMTIPGTWGLIACDPYGGDAPEPIAFLLMRVILDEAEILALGVTPPARRRGAARALLRAGLSKARSEGAATAFLEVGADNAGAIGLYEAAGFDPHGTRKGYYRRANGDRVDACLMRYYF